MMNQLIILFGLLVTALGIALGSWLLFPNLKFGNNTFDLGRFARRQRRQPQNMARLLPTFQFGSNISSRTA